jgi:hypothetical protein
VRACTIGAQKDDVADGQMRGSQKLPRDQDGRRLGFNGRGGCARCGRQYEKQYQETRMTTLTTMTGMTTMTRITAIPGIHELIIADSQTIQAMRLESAEARR